MNTLPEVINPQSNSFKSHFTEVTTISKITAAVVFMVLPFIGFYLGTTYSEGVATIDAPLPEVMYEPVQELQYKESAVGGEIPVSWSVYQASDAGVIDTWPVEGSLQKHVVSSVSASEITFYDWNADQVDMYWLSYDAGNQYLNHVAEMKKSDSGILIEDKVINGNQAKVITWTANDDQQFKGSGDGQRVFISTGTSTDSKYVLIDKQSKGDESFEKAFSHYLETLKLSDF